MRASGFLLRRAVAVALGLCVFGAVSYGQGIRFAVGLVAGDPAGLFLEAEGAGSGLRGLVGWDLRSPGGPAAALDVLVRSRPFDFLSLPLVPYAGLGLKATFLVGDGRFGDSAAERGFGLRLPLGVRHAAGDWPIEAFLETAPGLRFAPDFAFDFDAALGARILF
jgi:hypothetical protein